jgi:hypothetical protein
MSQISIRGPRVKSHWVQFPLFSHYFCFVFFRKNFIRGSAATNNTPNEEKKIIEGKSRKSRRYNTYTMANCIKTLGAYYGRPTWFEKVFPSSRPGSVRTVAPPKLTLGTDLKTKFVTMTVLTVAAFVYIIFMLIYVKIVRLL